MSALRILRSWVEVVNVFQPANHSDHLLRFAVSSHGVVSYITEYLWGALFLSEVSHWVSLFTFYLRRPKVMASPRGECSLGRLKSALRTASIERWPIRKPGNQTPITCPLLVVQVRWAFDLVVLEKTSVDPKRCHDLAWYIASNPFKWISSAEMPHFDDDGEHELGL